MDFLNTRMCSESNIKGFGTLIFFFDIFVKNFYFLGRGGGGGGSTPSWKDITILFFVLFGPFPLATYKAQRTALHTVQTVHTLHGKLPTSHFTLLTAHCTTNCTLHATHFTLSTSHCILHNGHCKLLTGYCTLHTAHCTLHTAH